MHEGEDSELCSWLPTAGMASLGSSFSVFEGRDKKQRFS